MKILGNSKTKKMNGLFLSHPLNLSTLASSMVEKHLIVSSGQQMGASISILQKRWQV
jgi:hypothetical protein